MGVKDWIRGEWGVENHVTFDDAASAGVLIRGTEFVPGVDGKALRCLSMGGATIDATEEVARGYPMSLAVWFKFPKGGLSVDVVRWGSIPSVGVRVHGRGAMYPEGTVEGWVRMSTGDYAMRGRSRPLEPDVWHLAVITVEQVTIWGGVRASMFIDGDRVASSQIDGGLLNIMNFDRPTLVTFGVGSGEVTVDECVLFERELGFEDVRGLYGSPDVDLRGVGSQAGWGVVF